MITFEKVMEVIRKMVPLRNDIFMCFAKNKAFCQEFLRIIMQDKELVVLDNEIQKYFPDEVFKKNVIDILCKLSDGRIVCVEIQLYKEKDHAKRLMSYASAIIRVINEKGSKYQDVKDVVIIYLTDTDIFNLGSTVYNVDMKVVADTGKIVEDWDAGLKIYYINTEGLTNKNIHSYLKLFTDTTTLNINEYPITTELKQEIYTNGGNNNMSRTLYEAFKDEIVKEREEGIQQGMQQGMQQGIQQGMQQGIQQGREQGMQQGMQQGREAGTIAALVNAVKKGFMSMENASSMLNISVEQFKSLMEM